MNFFTYIIMALLSLDSIRALIAMIGWIKPESKFSWLIYGRYERNLIKSALKEIGFSDEKSRYTLEKLRDISSQISSKSGVSEDNVIKHLIALIAKYIIKFDSPIQYGGNRTTRSRYYIDTMEISHVQEDLGILCAIMVHLYNKNNADHNKPEIIITPKGGNPFLTWSVAGIYNAVCLVAKSENDKSRISSIENNSKEQFLINYEGAWATKHRNLKKCIIMDCNISGGSQLLNIAKEVQAIKDKEEIDFMPPKDIYVLFCADDQIQNIDQKFSDFNCQLHRFFDLDEELKSMIYKLREMCESQNLDIGIYVDEVSTKIDEIISKIKSKSKLYY